MSDKKYIILQQHKFGYNVQDQWTVKFADLNEDKAFEKMVALDTLNEDRERYSHHLQEVTDKGLLPLVLTDEVKEEQSEMPF